MGRLHVDMFLQDRFLLNGVDVMIQLVHSKDAFALMAGGANHDYKVNIIDASVFARQATLSTAVQMAHIKARQRHSQVSTPPGRLQSLHNTTGCHVTPHENLFLGTLPKRLVLCSIDNDAFNGSYSKKTSTRSTTT